MSDGCCPHCGSTLPLVRDAFCVTCREPLDEPREVPRTPEEQVAFRARVEQEAKEDLRLWLSLIVWKVGLGGRIIAIAS
jgi:predicted amidophosphoribosyltransferase